MLRRPLFLALTLFWITMNLLLWRSEFGPRAELGNSIPPEVVWEKILTAPDDSALEISHDGRKIGYCRWLPNIGEESATGKVSSEDVQPEGMIKKLSGYTIDFEGSFLPPASNHRVRFGFHAIFNTNQLLQDFTLSTVVRPNSLQIKTFSAEQRLEFNFDDGASRWNQSVAFHELRNPVALAERLGLPLPPFLWAALPQTLPLPTPQPNSQTPTHPTSKHPLNPLSFAPKWIAQNDWLTIGHSRIRVYRLTLPWLDRQQITVQVSRVGEILRVQLPNHILLLNEAFLNL